MATIISTTFRLKRGLAERWQELNLVLDPGEPGFELDTYRLKIGDGETPWNDLPYVGGPGTGTSGDSIVVDTVLSNTSLNPIANKAVKAALDSLEALINDNSYDFGNGFVVTEADGIKTVEIDPSILNIDVSNFVSVDEFDKVVKTVEALVAYVNGLKIPTKVSELKNDAGYLTEHQDLSDYALKDELAQLKDYEKATKPQIKYEVMPHDGVIVEYNDSEIRVNTQRVVPVQQQVGPTGSPNYYYIEFRAYAPEGATHYKEWENDNKVDTFHDFTDSFSGIDKYGRKYSTIWMAVAYRNGSSWTLYSSLSTKEKYLGFRYSFEWYKDGNLISTDQVRVILTNDSCHNELIAEPTARYVDNKVADLKTIVEENYITIENAVTKETLVETVEKEVETVLTTELETIIEEKVADAVTEGVSVNKINYGTF